MAEKIFVDGLFVKRADKAPDFVIANLSFNVDKFAKFIELQDKQNGWVNIDLKKSKTGSMYAEVNTWKPNKVTNAPQENIPVIEDGEVDIKDIPF